MHKKNDIQLTLEKHGFELHGSTDNADTCSKDTGKFFEDCENLGKHFL